MTDANWTKLQQWADVDIDPGPSCTLELRTRFEVLEKRCEVQLMQLSDLQQRHHRLATQTAHLESEVYADEPEQHCVEALELTQDGHDRIAELLGLNSKPTPKSSQVRESLVERVHSCIVGEPECGRMQARAVIREVALWLREHGHSAAADVLEVMKARR